MFSIVMPLWNKRHILASTVATCSARPDGTSRS